MKATEHKSPIMTAIPITLSGYETDMTEQELAHTQNANDGRKALGTHQKHTVVAVTIDEADLETDKSYNQRGVVHSPNGVSRTVMGCGHAGNEPKVAVPVLTPDRAEKRQNGRRFKENGEEMFTLTAQDRHGVMVDVANTEQSALKIKEATSKGYAEAEVGDSINFTMPSSQTRRGRIGKECAQTLDTACNQGTMIPINCEDESSGFPQLTPIGGDISVTARILTAEYSKE